MCAVSLAASILTGSYPLYNLVKRMFKKLSTFASSSFCNNGLEWSYGVMTVLLLLSLKLALTDIYTAKFPEAPQKKKKKSIRNSFVEQNENSRTNQFSDADATASAAARCLAPLSRFSQPTYANMELVSLALAGALNGLLLLTNVLYSATWGSKGVGDALTLGAMWGGYVATTMAGIEAYRREKRQQVIQHTNQVV